MTPVEFTCVLFAISLAAGLLGALLGLGGGFVVVPALTLLFGINIRLAIGASIVAVVATSSGAASTYVRERMTNLRVAMALEVATVSGALTGALISGVLSVGVLSVVFGLVLVASAVGMLRNRAEAPRPVPPSRTADLLKLHATYYDSSSKRLVPYRVARLPVGAVMMYMAGTISGLLGVGGGAFKVPAMDLAMRLPIKVSTATSNFMIGVTGAASAGVYFGRGDIHPFIVAPVAAGVLIGARTGSKALPRLTSGGLRVVFAAVLLAVAAEMMRAGL